MSSRDCCRTMLPKRPEWGKLPTHLLVLVMQKVWESDKRRSYQDLPFVCKSWREAYLQSSADIDSAFVSIHSSTSLFGVCKLLPGLSSLSIKKEAEMIKLRLHPLSNCSRLTSLFFNNNTPSSGVPVLDLLHMPSGLRLLRVDAFKIEQDGFEYIRCNELTKVILLSQALQGSGFQDFLHCLPDLKVRLCFNTCPIVATSDTFLEDRSLP